MEGLNLDNILGGEEVDSLFMEPEDTPAKEKQDEASEGAGDDSDKKDNDTTEVDPDSLFDDVQPESVGSGNNDEEEKGDTSPEEGSDTSPNNFYSSIANALAMDGIFLNSDEDAVKKVDSAESFSDLIEAEIASRLDERQQRISKALDNGVEPTDIRKYENTLQYIDSINDSAIAEESEKGEQLRKNLIYQDFLNKGYTPEKAQKFMERAIDAGTDVEDAKEALQSNREFFQNAYNNLLREAQQEADKEKAERQKQSDKLKQSILKDKELMGGMDISDVIRKKTFDNISKPVYKDPETGQYLTALQKYEAENRGEFLKYAGLMYTITNGFKDFDSIFKGEVKKKVKSSLMDLEQKLNTTKRNSNGGLQLVTGVKEDPESYFKGIKLDF